MHDATKSTSYDGSTAYKIKLECNLKKIEARKAQLIAEMTGRIYERREENYFSI